MPRHNYYKIQPHVKALCEKYDVKYIEKEFKQAFLDIFL
jgi:hypothetical protein